MNEPKTWEFDGWVLETGSGDLRRNGAVIRLQEQPLRILVALLERPGEVVTREELIARLWPHGVVEFDMGLNTAVRKLRLALADDAETPRYIETIPRRGYRFVGQLADSSTRSVPDMPLPQPGSGEEASSRQRRGKAGWWVLAGTIALALLAALTLVDWRQPAPSTGLHSLAVLPFGPLTQAPDDAALGLGVAGALITRLSTVPEVRVSPLGSVRRHQPDADPLLIARELGVDAVLEGHLQQQQNRLRVSARLLRVADGASLWSGQFDEVMDDLFAMQDTIAERVAAAISPRINSESRFADWPAETTSPEAFRQFAAAQYNQFRRDTNGVPTAIAYYEAALAADPRYADAWAGLSVALMVEAVFGMQPTARAAARAREAAQRALEANPQSPAALGAMGHVLIQADRRYAEGLEYYRRALAANPDQAIVHQWLAIAQAHLGNTEVALEHIRRAQSLEPRALHFASNVGLLLYFARRNDEAISQLEALLRLEPRMDQALSALGNARLARSDVQGALEAFRARATPGPGGLGDLGRAYAVAGDRVAAAAELERLRALAAQGFGVAHDEATIHALLGDRKEACSALERALGDGSQMMGFLRVDPRLDAIRGEPCYARVERELYRTAP